MLSRKKTLAKIRGNRRAFRARSVVLYNLYMKKLDLCRSVGRHSSLRFVFPRAGRPPEIGLGIDGRLYITFEFNHGWGRTYVAEPYV